MFGQKKQNKSGGWGKQSSPSQQDVFWEGGSAPPSSTSAPTGSSQANVVPEYKAEGAPKNIIELFDPIFQFICSKHRVDREGEELMYSQVRRECDQLIDSVSANANKDVVLLRQYEKLKDPLLWYIDYWFGSSGDFRSLRSEWNRDRLGISIDDGDIELSGDEAFFEELDKTLKEQSADGEANERLAFFYTAIGLGFTGPYFKSIPEHENKLRDYMEKMYPRVQGYIDSSGSSKVTPECYQYTDKRDFVAPLRDRPMILMLAALFLVAALFFGYLWFYGNHKKEWLRCFLCGT